VLADEIDKLIRDEVKRATLRVSDSFASKDDREISPSFEDIFFRNRRGARSV
jgi:hypothetical protein